MSMEFWTGFTAASIVLLAIPERGMIEVAAYALGHGRRSAFATVTGVALGYMAAAGILLAGLIALSLVSPLLFSVVKGAGLGFLVISALRLWRAPGGNRPIADNDNLPVEKPLNVMVHCFAATGLNLRTIALLAAFLPQFLTLSAPLAQEALTMVAILGGLSMLIATAYAMGADEVRNFLRKHRARRVVDRSRGTVLIAARSVTAGYRKIAA
ncbi:LysE family translocator [Rhizobium sp. AAP43]|uniref:LysE family translocator n=1 Tax=Rhizobium sp. AAP43 TaxID=1523420 RepID=UPI0006B95F64|nr:LysE family translocator [Rhizobium sp. AAP43]KPF42436.1 hypothetical protein IP76_17490 [Rhizobium sp. AAP43]